MEGKLLSFVALYLTVVFLSLCYLLHLCLCYFLLPYAAFFIVKIISSTIFCRVLGMEEIFHLWTWKEQPSISSDVSHLLQKAGKSSCNSLVPVTKILACVENFYNKSKPHISLILVAPICSDIHTRNVSCPISPIRSPMSNARSSWHMNGRISSPISSPITTSGSSTPITGCGGDIPVSQPRYLSSLHEGFTNAPRVLNSRHASASTHDPKLGIFRGKQKGSLLWGK